MEEYYFTQLLAGVIDCLSYYGYSLIVSNDCVFDERCEGIIVTGLNIGEDISLLSKIDIPLVLQGKSALKIDWIDIDNIDGTYQVTKHLIENGHRDISFIGISNKESYCIERFQGFILALEDYGLAHDSSRYFDVENDTKVIKREAKYILSNLKGSAIVCANDKIAYGIIQVAKELNLRIPEHISIVGFDGFLHNEMMAIALTTVEQSGFQMGLELSQVLIDRINNKDAPLIRRKIKTTLIHGETVRQI
jgi:LacI family transcriptional regulator